MLTVLVSTSVALQAFEISFTEQNSEPLLISKAELQVEVESFTVEAAVGESKIIGASANSFNIPVQSDPIPLVMVHISNSGADSAYSAGQVVCVDFAGTLFKGPGSEELAFKIPQACTYPEGALALPPPPAPSGSDSDDGSSAAIIAGVIAGVVVLILLIALIVFAMKRRRQSPKQSQRFASKHVEMEEQGGSESSPYKNDNLSGAPLSVRVAGASQAAASGPNAV